MNKSLLTAAHIYVKSAPQFLVRLHEDRVAAGADDETLNRLLVHPLMARPWRVLASKVRCAADWHALLVTIDWCIDEIRYLQPSRESTYRSVAKRAKALAAVVDDIWPSFYTIELYSEGLRKALRGSTPPIPVDQPWKLQDFEWPTVAELLKSLSRSADEFADDAMKELRLVRRKVSSRKGKETDWRVGAFLGALSKEFFNLYGSPMYGTVAAIANVILRTDIGPEQVRRAARRWQTLPLKRARRRP